MNKARIIARLHDGLGNQLFLYAAARGIAEARAATLALDMQSGFARDRKYGASCQLQHFAVTAEIVNPGLFSRRTRDLRMALSQRLPRERRFVIREADFDPVMAGAPLRRTLWLEGYWQSERYFAPIAPKIAEEFKVVTPLSGKSTDVARRIGETTAVCFHVRQMHGAHHSFQNAPPPHVSQLPFSYYEEAVSRLAGRVPNPTFFVFADNFEWIRARWQFPYPVQFVDHNEGGRAYEDIALMARCQHFIIGNSTLSWWGAWLGRSPEKIVFAPENRGRVHWGSEADLLPARWNVLKVA